MRERKGKNEPFQFEGSSEPCENVVNIHLLGRG